MRDTLRLLGIIALAVIIGFSMVACDNGSTTDSGDKTPVASDYIFQEVVQKPLGETPYVTITAKSGKSPGGITILYDGSPSVPTSTGTYIITFNVAEAGGWKAATGLAAGKLVISNTGGLVTPTGDDYSVSGLDQVFNGEPKRVTIVPRPGKSLGTVYNIRYAGSLTEPSAKGTYLVTFDVEGTVDYDSATNLSGGQMVIRDSTGEKVTPIATDFIVVGLGTYPVNQDEDMVRWVFVEGKDNKTKGNITVKYNGSTDKPKAVNTYIVTIDVEESGGFSEVKDLYLGELIITEGKEPQANWFVVSGLNQAYDGMPRAVLITPKVDYQALEGRITRWYTPAGGVRTMTPPNQIGTYKVTFDVAAAPGFVGVTGLDAGELVIEEAAQTGDLVAGNFNIEGLSTFPFNASLPRIVTVEPRESKYSGQIEVSYALRNGAALAAGDKPTNAGTYDVFFTVKNAAKYRDAFINAGELTIHQIDAIDVTDYETVNVIETYNGEAKKVDIRSATLGSDARYTIRYDGNEYGGVGPVYAGEYGITFDVVGSTNWKQASNISGGTMDIKKGTPKETDFTYTQASGKEWDGTAISGTLLPTYTPRIGGLEVSNGDKVFTYNGETASPVDVATYDVALKIGSTTNWNEVSIPLSGKVVITPRAPTKDDFDVAGTSQIAYSNVVPPVFTSRNNGVRTYPSTPPIQRRSIVIKREDNGQTLTDALLRDTAPGRLLVSLTLAANGNFAATPANAPLVWEMTVADLEFTTAEQFRDWLTGRGNGTYSVRFSTQAIKTPADLKIVTRSIGARSTTSQPLNPDDLNPDAPKYNWGNNGSKLIKLDLTGALDPNVNSLSEKANLTIGSFEACDNLLELDIGDSSIATFDAKSFAGCSKLAKLVLPNVPGSITFPATALQDCGALKFLDTGKLTSITRDVLTLANGSRIQLSDLVLRTDSTGVAADDVATSLGAFDRLTSLRNVEFDDVDVSTFAFKSCTGLEKVKFPVDYSGSIGISAFEDCTNKAFAVEWPADSWNADPAPEIGANAFRRCTSLTTVDIAGPSGDDGVEIAADAFTSANAITTVTLATDGTASDGVGAWFRGKKSLTTVVLDAGVTKIGANAFTGCTGLTSVTLDDGITEIGDSAFEGCSSLASIVLPTDLAGADAIGAKAFMGCSALSAIDFTTVSDLSAYVAIKAGTFKNSGLKSIIIPGDVVTINGYANAGATTGDGAFEGCTKLVSVQYDVTSLTTIQWYAFAGCTSLTTFNTDLADTTISGKVIIPAEIPQPNINVFKGCTSISEVVITTPAATVEAHYLGETFSGCAGLTTITFTGNALKTSATASDIKFESGGNNALSSIQTIIWDIDNGIDGTAVNFSGTGAKKLVVSTALTSTNVITNSFPDSLVELELTKAAQAVEDAFDDLENVEKVVINTAAGDGTGAGIAIGAGAGKNILPKNTTEVYFVGALGSTLATTMPFNGVSANGLTVSVGVPTTTELNVDGIETIILRKGAADAAISGLPFSSTVLKDIIVADNSTYYRNNNRDGVLYSTTGGVTTLVQYPRKKDIGGTGIYYILDGVGVIAANAFQNNADIKGVKIPSSVTNIGSATVGPFTGTMTNFVEEVIYDAKDASIIDDDGDSAIAGPFPLGLKKITIGPNVEKIPSKFLGVNTQITKVVIPSNVKEIGQYSFTKATAITEVELNANLITNSAFNSVATINKVTIGSDVTIIKALTFFGTKIAKVNLQNVVYIEGSAFAGTDLNDLFVPESVVFIGGAAFASCSKLQEVKFAGSSVYIDNSTDAFPTGDGTVLLKTAYEQGGAGVYRNGATGSGWGWRKDPF